MVYKGDELVVYRYLNAKFKLDIDDSKSSLDIFLL